MSIREEILFDKLQSDLAIKRAESEVLEKYPLSHQFERDLINAAIKSIEEQLKPLYAK